jgi:hypothetical protein
MTLDRGRAWIIKASLVLAGTHLAFFVLAPATGYPLTFSEAMRLVQIVIPVFFAYVGSATHFLFKPAQNGGRRVAAPALLALLVKWPLVLFGLVSVVALVAFGVSNRPGGPRGGGMELNTLAAIISATLGLLAITTNVIVQYLFATADAADVNVPAADAQANQAPTGAPVR